MLGLGRHADGGGGDGYCLGAALLSRGPNPQDLVLTLLRLDQEVARLAGGDPLARLEALESGERDGDLGPGLARPCTVLADDQVLLTGTTRWNLQQSIFIQIRS